MRGKKVEYSKPRILPKILCASCHHCVFQEIVKGRRVGLCTKGVGTVAMDHPRQCLYWRPFGGDGRG